MITKKMFEAARLYYEAVKAKGNSQRWVEAMDGNFIQDYWEATVGEIEKLEEMEA